MRQLAQREITHVLFEGGGEVIASALAEDIVDRVLFFIAPKIVGGRDAPTSVEGLGVKDLEHALKLKDVQMKRFGDDFLLSGYL
jgi:diaminohydroxyphosphoribosylaminopyrimidine deaminase/5-amino-6-(5-phosphoribosylamino)uracil reductase